MNTVPRMLDITHSPKCMLLLDPVSGRILEASAAALAFYGWSREEILGMHIYEINTLRHDEIQAEMSAALKARRNYFRFRHITKAGEVRRVHVISLPIRYDGADTLLSIIDSPQEAGSESLENIKGIFEFAADPMLVLKITDDAAQGTVVFGNGAARSFFGEGLEGKPFSEGVLVYDRKRFEAAVGRMMAEYSLETDLLLKGREETTVWNVGFNRLFYDSDYYVMLQLRPPKGLRVNRLRRSELMLELDQAISRQFQVFPDAGCFGLLGFADADLLFRSLGKEEYMRMLLGAGKSLRSHLGITAGCELMDESLLFFHAGITLEEGQLRELLGAQDRANRLSSPGTWQRLQCVEVSYHGEAYHPEYGLAQKLVSALDGKDPLTRVKLITEKDLRRAALLKGLEQAPEREELFLLYQPIVDMVRGEIVSTEALVRWQHPELGLIEPGEFIPLAEESGHITAIDRWVLEAVLKRPRVYPVHINLSTQDLLDSAFRARVLDVLERHAEDIVLELTETTNHELSAEIQEALNGAKARLSIDDFGTGYSSMSRLTSLNVSSLKIDRSFVAGALNDVGSASVCIAIIRLGKSLNVEVIAEGVETLEQMQFLYRNGCRLVQGYGLSRPIPWEELQHLDMKPLRIDPGKKYGVDRNGEPVHVDFGRAMLVELSDQMTILRAPMAFSRFLGYPQQELLGKSFFDLIPLEELPRCLENCRVLKDTGYIDNAFFYIAGADGVWRCVSASGRKGTGGDLSSYLYIEPNEAAEERMLDFQAVQGAYSTVFHEAPLATVVWRQDYEIIDWNREAEDTFGWTRAEAVGRNLVKLLIDKETFPNYMEALNTLQHSSSQDGVNFNVTKDGRQIICRWVNRTVRNAQGEIRFYISMAKDITEDLLKNDQIRQLSSAVEKSGSGVVLTDDCGVILSANSRFAQLTGYAEAELVGSSISVLSSHELPREVYEDLWRTIKSGRAWEGEVHDRRKDGTLYWCKTTIVPVVSEWSSRVHYLGIQKDLTAEKEQEEKAASLRGLMMEQEKLATLGSMLAGITHETFNYMAYAESNLQYSRRLAEKALDGAPLNPEVLLEALKDTEEGMGRLKELLQSLKQVSRKEEKPRAETVDVVSELRMVSGLVRNEYKYYANLEILPEGELLHRGYPGLLRQVLMNLIINAAHAVRSRGSQTLGRITLDARRQQGLLCITVQDDGIGMDAATQERIFEPFFTTKKSGEGTGLGLSISKQLIEAQYGGTLECRSEPGAGTTFTITVPEAAEQKDPEEEL